MTVTLEPVARVSEAPESEILVPAGREADAAGLFRDEPEIRTHAYGDARRHARTCPNCEHVVPAGMSLCGACGFDLETGVVTDTLAVVSEVAPAEPAATEISAGALLAGWSAMALGVGGVLGGALLVGGEPLAASLLFCGAGVIWGAILYLTGRSYKRLMMALALLGFCGVVLLIAMPIFQASDAAAASDAETGGVLRRIDNHRLAAGVSGLVMVVVLLSYLAIRGPARR